MLIVQNHADPYIRNGRQESPLDLAAQYGRMETVSELSLLLEDNESFVDQSQTQSNRSCLIWRVPFSSTPTLAPSLI